MNILFENQLIEYRNESTQKPLKQAMAVSVSSSAQHILKNAHNQIASVWKGDFHQAKQILSAMKKRVRKPISPQNDPATAFHLHRLAKSQQSRLINSLLIEIKEHFVLDLPRAPDVSAALRHVYEQDNDASFLLPLNQLLGFIGAYEWYQKGIEIQELKQIFHIPFGVFSPLRGEYLALMMKPDLPPNIQTALDVGTGSGVLAGILSKRGVPNVLAIDNNPRAVACAQQNLDKMSNIRIIQGDLFPDERVDLMVCNPPWLPAKPTSVIETALYDDKHLMLKNFLEKSKQYLNSNGRIWLIMSDLAEYLGLRDKNILNQWFDDFGWTIEQMFHTRPTHAKAYDESDPLAFARNHEVTTLYVLKSKFEN